MKLSEAVREIIRLGDASRAYWDRELPKHHPHYPMIGAGEDSGPPPPEDAQIQALLNSLPEDQLYTLLLLLYVGRGDFSADHLLSAYQTMKETFSSRDLAIAQITGMTALAEYLTDALEEIRKRHINEDSLKFTSTAGVS
jgi:Protein of unknown function (DUF3775)